MNCTQPPTRHKPLSVKAVIEALDRERKWVAAQRGKRVRPESADRIEDVVAGCVWLLQQATRRYRGWLDRRDRRRLPMGRAASYPKPRVNNAILALIDLVLSDLSLRPVNYQLEGDGFGCFEIRGPRFASKPLLDALAKARAAKAAKRNGPRAEVENRKNELLKSAGKEGACFSPPQVVDRQGVAEADFPRNRGLVCLDVGLCLDPSRG